MQITFVTADNFFNTNTSLEDGNINADTFFSFCSW